MKERLTGAIILVILIVLLVPELLSGPKRPSASAPAGAPASSSEEPPLRSYTINLDDSRPRAAANGGSGPAMPVPSGPEQPTTPADSPTATGAAAAATTAGGAVADTPSAGSSAARTPAPNSQSAVSGSASDSASQPAPQPTHTQTSAKSNQPQQSHQAAPATVAHTSAAVHPQTTQKLAAAAKPEVAPKDEPSPKAEAGSWAVQLGVFASRENAERLALDVRTKGFKVAVSPVTGSSRKLYRVRVGPAADRAAAQELQGRLKALGRPGGTVVPYS